MEENFKILPKRYRFYIPDTDETIYPKYCHMYKYGDNPDPFFEIQEDDDKEKRFLNPSKIDFYPQLATGVMAFNGEIFQDDVVFYNNKRYRVSYNQEKDSFELYKSSIDVIPFSELPEYAGANIEILGTTFSDIILHDENDKNLSQPSPNTIDETSEEQDIQSFATDSLEEDFLWDDEATELIEMSFSHRPIDKCDIFIKSVLDRKSSTGAWAFYFSGDTRFISSNKENTSNKKELEMICLKNALSELSSPHTIRIHLDNGFLKKLLNNKIETPLDGLEDLLQEINDLASKHFISFELENINNPVVEGVIAYDAARKVL